MSFNVTAKIVSQSASRALGLLIAKFKALGGMPYDVVYQTLRFSWLTALPYGAIGRLHASMLSIFKIELCASFRSL